MFGIGLPELIVILALALVVLGPEKLPQVAKQAARLINELKRASDDFKKELELDKLDDIKKPLNLDKVIGKDLSEIVKEKTLVGPDFLKSSDKNRGAGGLGPEWKVAEGRGKEPREPSKPESESEAGQQEETPADKSGEQPDSLNAGR